MATPLCTPQDVGVRLGLGDAAYTGDDLLQVAQFCDDVSGLIRARRPQIDTWIANGSVAAGTVVAVACQVVARLLTTAATGGIGLRGETHPEHSYELTSTAAAGLTLSDRELALITPQAGRSRPFSIQPR